MEHSVRLAFYKKMVAQQNKRAEQRDDPPRGRVTLEQWLMILEKYEHRCLKCKMKEAESVTGRLTMDHVVSLRNGGLHNADNIQPLCIWCNKGKQDRDFDYRPESYGHALADGRRWMYDSEAGVTTWSKRLQAEWGNSFVTPLA
jgi:5-methylcytosine-specific restriction endonuclease McrA